MPRVFEIRRYLPRSIMIAAATLVATATARAGIYEISYTSAIDPTAITGNVFITTADTSAGSPSLVLSISGERNGVPVTMLSAYASSDQLLYSTPSVVDFSGISFSTAAAGDFNLYSNSGNYYETSSVVDPNGYGVNANQINLSVTAVPEPAPLALFSLGLLALCVLLYGRRHPSLVTEQHTAETHGTRWKFGKLTSSTLD